MDHKEVIKQVRVLQDAIAGSTMSTEIMTTVYKELSDIEIKVFHDSLPKPEEKKVRY